MAIVVPVHNRLSLTKTFLSELRRSDHEEALVVIVDDGSTDGTSEYLRDHHPDVVVLPGPGDLWWSGAANLGCRFASDRGARVFLLFNNDHVRVSANCVTELTRCVEAYGGCASSVAVQMNSDRLLHAGGLLNWPLRGPELRESGAIYHPEERTVECDWLPGMSLAFSAELFEQLGGFDERTFPQYYGDADFTLRARAKGKRCVVSYLCWVSNDEEKTGMSFYSRVSLVSFLSGLVSVRSNYQFRSAILFATRYCPRRFVALYLAFFYLRYVYATMKTWMPARLRVLLAR